MAAEEEGVQIEELDEDGKPVDASEDVADAADETKEAAKDEDPQDAEISKIEKEKEGMTVVEKLERSLLWKVQGNDFFKASELVRACDAYYHSIIYCRDLCQNPQYYPKIGHTEEQRGQAREICESCFSNLALVQTKCGNSMAAGDPERRKVLEEAAKSATEALKINAKNLKAMFRRGSARMALSKGAGVGNEEAQRLCNEARADFLAVAEAEPSNRDARGELKNATERLRELKREEAAAEKKEFSFAKTLSGVGSKEKDLLGDGSLKKMITKVGDGGKWLNKDWLTSDAPQKCLVQAKFAHKGSDKPVILWFVLGSEDMHAGMSIAVQSMTLGEVAEFRISAAHLAATGALAKLLPQAPAASGSDEVVWEIEFLKFQIWEDLKQDGSRLRKIHNEGYGEFPQDLAEVHVHWRVTSADGSLVHSSRYTLNLAGEGGLKHVEDEDKPALAYVLGESTWEPVGVLCRSLRQGGVGELFMRKVPALPKESTADGNSAQLSMVMSKLKANEDMRNCFVRVELERVVRALRGPEDPRWEGALSLVKERAAAQGLLDQGRENEALIRLRRVVAWAEQELQRASASAEREAASRELAEARAMAGWLLVGRAAPILDLGNVTSAMRKAADADVAEAEQHCAWLEEHKSGFLGTLLLRAKLLVAQDDDFLGAHKHLLEAQKLAPDDKRVQEELKLVKGELRKTEEAESRKRVEAIRDSLRSARGEGRTEAVLELLRELAAIRVSWDTVMDTRIGVELKCCQEGCGEDARKLCCDILGRFKDESKEQRPLWAS